MTQDINFSAYDSAHADTAAKAGEVYTPYNLIDTGDGAYRNAPQPMTVVDLPPGYRWVALHTYAAGSTNLIVADETDMLYFMPHDQEAPYVSSETFTPIECITDIRDVQSLGNMLVLVTGTGLLYLIYCAGSYRVFNRAPEMPEIEFGLQRAGTLASGDRIVISSTGAADAVGAQQTGTSASRLHPTAAGMRGEVTDISVALTTIITDAVRSQCTAKGYVNMPFFVRYALRLFDGTYIEVLSPILMLPTVLPPRIGVMVNNPNAECTEITVDLSSNNYFELRHRVLDDRSLDWLDIIAAVDIFVSEPVATYDIDSVRLGYITDFTSVAEQTDSGGFRRGRQYPEREDHAGSQVFDGHYSIGSDVYIDHYLDTDSLGRVWYIAPNHRLQDQLMSVDTFYRIASIPYQDLCRSETFTPVPLLTSDFSHLTEHKTLGECCQVGTEIVPSAIRTYGSQLVIASAAYRLPPPPLLRASSPYYGDASAPTGTVEVCVYSQRQGTVYRTRGSCRSMPEDLADAFPRYLYCDDPAAYMMTFTQGGVTRSVTLTPHETLGGAYWWGGLGANYVPEPCAHLPDCDDTGLITGLTMIYTSMSGNPLCMQPEPLQMGDMSVLAMRSAMEAPKLGSFGQYPLYAFTGSGIWMLQYSDAQQAIVSAKMIARDSVSGAHAVTEADGAVLFISGSRLMSVEGSKVQCLSNIDRCFDHDISRLPHYTALLEASGAEAVDDDTGSLLAGAIMVYSPAHGMVLVGNPDRDYSLLYSLSARAWCTCDAVVRGVAQTGAEGAWVGESGDVMRLTDSPDPVGGVLVTRPIRLTAPAVPADISAAEAIGDFESGHVSTAVYGTCNVHRWNLVDSSLDHCVNGPLRRPCRYHIVAIATRLSPGEYVTGVQISSQDSAILSYLRVTP